MEIALVGMPNCGKSTLFNALTGKHARTGNRAGVTVSLTKGTMKGEHGITLTDLPGIYSPVAGSEDEALTLRSLEKEPPDLLLFVADGTQLARSGELLTALRAGHRTVLAVNMCDELEKAGTVLDSRALENYLDIPVFAISAKSGQGVPELAQYLRKAEKCYRKSTPEKAKQVKKAKQRPACAAFPGDSQGSRAPCSSRTVPGTASAENPPTRHAFYGNLCRAGCAGCAQNGKTAPAVPRSEGTDDLSRAALPPPPQRGRLQDGADRLFLTPWTGFPCLILFLAAVLFLSFGAPGTFLAGRFSALLALPLCRLFDLLTGSLPAFPAAFLKDGVLAGTLAVLDFAPRLFLLFLLLTILEDSGYLARAGALAAPVLRFFGLSGEAAVPLLLGLGCSVPAVLSTRHIRDNGTRRLSVFLLPFIPCSARLPVIAVLAALFFASPFAARAVPVLGGVILFLLFAFAFSRKNRPAPFAGELPRYRMPCVQNVCRVAARRTGHFLRKAGGLIPLAAAILWLLSHITPHGTPTDAGECSLLAVFSGAIAPVFAPLGFGCWQAVAALISGIAAKETVLSALAVFAGGDLGALAGMFSPRGALSFLCFFATYTPCVATLGAVRREGGWRALFGCLLLSFAGAYALSFAVYHL